MGPAYWPMRVLQHVENVPPWSRHSLHFGQLGRKVSGLGCSPGERFRRSDPGSIRSCRLHVPKDIRSPPGILIHVLDGWEQNGAAWAPTTNGPGATDMSASLVFAANVAASGAISLCASCQFEPLSEGRVCFSCELSEF